MTSSTNSWLHTSLLSPSAQQQSAQHALYGTDLPMHSSAHLAPQQHVELGHDGHHTFGPAQECPFNLEFHHSADSHPLHDLSRPSGGSCSGHVAVGGDSGGHVSARKVHKADREKLRRDRLNEQFAELAGVLDPDRPKNDKATILGDGVQVVRELRSELKRLKTEQASLLDESRDLQQEKTELREEKASLKNETEQLQGQLQQRLRLMLPWMAIDPSMIMGASPFGYPVPVAQPVSGPPSTDLNQPASQSAVLQPVATPQAYIPLAPTAPGAFALHPMQAYTMFGGRPGEGSTPYLPYPHYPTPVNSHSHVERPYPQYPSAMQPSPGYLMQMQPHQGQPPISGAPSVPSSMYQPFAPGMLQIPSRTQASQPNAQSRGHPVAPFVHHGASGLQPYLSHSEPVSQVQTTLQLQTPFHPQPQRPSQVRHIDGAELPKAPQDITPGSSSELQAESPSQVQEVPTSGVADSTTSLPKTLALGGLSSPGAMSTSNRVELVEKCSEETRDPELKDPPASEDAPLTPRTT